MNVPPPPTSYTPHDSTTVISNHGNGNIIWEKDHHHAALYLPLLRGKLARGAIFQDKKDPAVKNNPGGFPRGLRFLYNPTDVNVSYSLSTSIYPTGAQPDATTPIIGVPGASSVSFSLILDRTHDVWHDRHSHGIMFDVRQWEAMLGYNEQRPYVQPVAAWVVFGNPKLRFYGFINSFAILYSNWTQEMVPYRGGIHDIVMQTLPRAKHIGKQHYNPKIGSQGPGDTSEGDGRQGKNS